MSVKCIIGQTNFIRKSLTVLGGDRFLCTDQVLRILDETSYFYGHRQVIRMGLSVDFKLQNVENINVISVAIKRLYEFYF